MHSLIVIIQLLFSVSILPKKITLSNLRIDIVEHLLNFYFSILLKVLPWPLAESTTSDWTPCSSSCGWTAIKSRTLAMDNSRLMDNFTMPNRSSNGSSNGTANNRSTIITQFAFCKLDPCNGK
jgi:hypothetical protein